MCRCGYRCGTAVVVGMAAEMSLREALRGSVADGLLLRFCIGIYLR
jgi:hypothetical protein